MLTIGREGKVLDRMRDQTILVVGDIMIDRYVYGRVDRISPEAPVPVVHVCKESERPGGAANVAYNIKALGGRAIACGVIGDDAAGANLAAMLDAHGIQNEGLVKHAAVCTTVKTRVIADRQQVVRVDRESAIERVQEADTALTERVESLMAKVDGVIIEDYGKGVVTDSVVEAVLASAAARGIPVGYDPKDNHALAVKGVDLATPNFREACLLAGIPERPLSDEVMASEGLREAACVLAARWRTGLLMITLGPHGMYLMPRNGDATVIPTRAREVFDVSGAGDTVIAVALTALAAGADGREAAELANHAAGVVVGKLGTATCDRAELEQAIKEGSAHV